MSDPNAERSRILGYEVVHVKDVSQSRLGKWITDEWQAPALNCFVLRSTVILQKNETGAGSPNEKEVTLLIEGPPAESMFAIPADYTERSPAQIDEEYGRLFPGQFLFGSKLFDDSYHARHGGQ
jgi:hypothetical protein